MQLYPVGIMHIYRRALSYFRQDIAKLSALLVIIGISTVLGLLQSWPLAVLVDSVVTDTPRQDLIHRLFLAPLPHSRVAQIVGLAIAALGIRLGQEVLNMLRTLLNFRIGYDGLMRVRCELYQKLQVLHLAYHRSRAQGDVLYRLSTDTFGFQTLLNVFVTVLVSVMTLFIIVAIMLTRNVTLTVTALAIVPLLVAANLWFEKNLKHHACEARQLDSEFTSTIQRSMASISIIQAFGREAEEYAQFHNTVRNAVSAWLRLHWHEVCYYLTVGIIFGIGSAVLFGYGGYIVYRDQFLHPRPDGMTVGDLMILLSYLGMLYDPLCKITGAGASLQSGAASVARVLEVLDEDPVILNRHEAQPLPVRARTLRLEDVGFEYQAGQPVVDHIHVTIPPGQMVAFVGSSGVGKSTLLNLLPRFYDPTRGRITLDGYDLRDVRLRDWRKHIALVLQDSVILPTSIAENIAYGRPDAGDAQIRRAAQLAGAAGFIEKLPERYNTELQENGNNLSGGQRQRIAIARALLTEAPIMVLDEPTSALDPEHEHLIMKTLASLKRKRTIILVSHRLNTVTDCDQIFVMHDGCIVERGTHASLLEQRGHYYRMACHQRILEGSAQGSSAA